MGKIKQLIKKIFRNKFSFYTIISFTLLFILAIILEKFTKRWFFSWITEFTPLIILISIIILIINILLKRNKLILKILIDVVKFFQQVVIVVFSFVTITYFYEFFRAREDFSQGIFGVILILAGFNSP